MLEGRLLRGSKLGLLSANCQEYKTNEEDDDEE